MTSLQIWRDIWVQSMTGVLNGVFGFIPNLLGAIIFLIVGLLIARALDFAVMKVISFVKLDVVLRKLGFDRYLQRAGVGLNSGMFLGKVVYWIVVLIFAIGIFDILGLTTLSAFVNMALVWIFSRLIVAVLILFVAAFLAQFLRKVVNASVMGAKLTSAKFLGSLTWWVVMIFGVISALEKLGIDTGFIQTNLTNIILIATASAGLALALAFGLGGKDKAEKVLDMLEDKIENR
ncbi:MAG: hypothetical protein PHP35_00780 [Candidatus Colwellbacteria bacterium]|nr:hypothetical protein [Candidatus Colwellbacteria bacterium]